MVNVSIEGQNQLLKSKSTSPLTSDALNKGILHIIVSLKSLNLMPTYSIIPLQNFISISVDLILTQFSSITGGYITKASVY